MWTVQKRFTAYPFSCCLHSRKLSFFLQNMTTLLRYQYFSKFSSKNFGESSTPTNHRATETSNSNNHNDWGKFEFFANPLPNEQPEDIKLKQIFVDRSWLSLHLWEEPPLKNQSDILENERDNRQQVPDHNTLLRTGKKIVKYWVYTNRALWTSTMEVLTKCHQDLKYIKMSYNELRISIYRRLLD